MAKKKKTMLPKNFKEMIEAGDIAALKAVFDDCELDARGGYSKGTALSFFKVPDELVTWLVEQGADINAADQYKQTPLFAQAGTWCGNVELLLKLGADIEAPDYQNDTPLHRAADAFQIHSVRSLVAHGANVNAENRGAQTPLEKAMSLCRNANISQMAEIAVILLDAGAKVAPEMKEEVQRIGKEFEFHRESFNKDYLAETEAGLAQLYSLFGFAPEAKRHVHDGVSPIKATKTSWQEQHNELWDYLVPSSGHAKTVQGEVIRITGRVSDELYRNGGANWDADYRKMLDTLLLHFSSGTPLSSEELAEAGRLASHIRPKGDGDNEPDRLCELAIKWVLNNPNPVPLEKTEYKR